MPAKKKALRSTSGARARKKNEIVPTMLRMREDLRRRIEASARSFGQSMNEEMVSRLEMSFMHERMETRDTTIVDLLVGNKIRSGELLRNFIVELQRRPEWDFSEEGKKELLQRLSKHIWDPEKAADDLYDADFEDIFGNINDAQSNEAKE